MSGCVLGAFPPYRRLHLLCKENQPRADYRSFLLVTCPPVKVLAGKAVKRLLGDG
jgi:hypothetical protein